MAGRFIELISLQTPATCESSVASTTATHLSTQSWKPKPPLRLFPDDGRFQENPGMLFSCGKQWQIEPIKVLASLCQLDAR